MKKAEIIDCKNSLCSQNWEELRSTESNNVKVCDLCKENVYLAENKKEAVTISRSGKCVAFRLNEQDKSEIQRRWKKHTENRFYVGRPNETIILFEKDLKNEQ